MVSLLGTKQQAKTNNKSSTTKGTNGSALFKRFYLPVALAVGFGILHSFHVSTLFENDRHFSLLSSLEREMSFRTDMGFYYSYYKSLVEAPTMVEGILTLIYNNMTEYPKTINTLQRFNLYPEVVLAAFYRTYRWGMNYFRIPSKQCWQVDRGGSLSPVVSCEGLGEPAYFYLTGVWGCAFLTAVALFFYGYLMSESNWGGIICVLSFFFNHSEATRVMWTPPLRESFAYPYCLLQMLSVSSCLCHKKTSWGMILTLGTFTTCFLVSWQLSQYILLTQIYCLFFLFIAEVINRNVFYSILVSHIFGLINTAVLTYGNPMLLSSMYFCGLCSVLLVLSFHGVLSFLPYYFRVSVGCFAVATATFGINLEVKQLLDVRDDAHILNLLIAKFTGKYDFFTLLYTCSKEFDFMEKETLVKLCETLLLPACCVVILLVVSTGIISFGMYATEVNTYSVLSHQPHILYNFLQLGVFTVMSLLIMRLKLFFTPHLCIVVSMVASRKLLHFIPNKELKWAFLVLFISSMSVKGISNLTEQHSIRGQYSDPNLEELFIWVEDSTPKNAVFAGPMSVMANLMLSTRRPIVNHPHFEDAHLRNKTRDIYTIFSRKPAEEVYSILYNLKVNYVVLQDNRCFKVGKAGCSMIELWDVEDTLNKGKSPLCPQLFLGNPSPFQRVFQNEQYAVLHLPSQYVEIQIKQYQS